MWRAPCCTDRALFSQTELCIRGRQAELRIGSCLYHELFEAEGVSLAECCCCSQDSLWCGCFGAACPWPLRRCLLT